MDRAWGRPSGRWASVLPSIEFTDDDGTTLVAAAGQDGAVCVSAAEGGLPCGEPLRGHTDWATALSVAVRPGGRRVLLTGDDDTVRLWFAGSASPAHVIPLGVRIRSLLPVGDDIAVGADEGVLMLRPRWD